MLPPTIALIDDDLEYADFLSQHLRDLGTQVDVFRDSNDLVTDVGAYGYGFYVVDLSLPGLDGTTLIGLLRRRTRAGVLVVSGQLAPGVFKEVVDAGADAYLSKPVRFEQVEHAIRAIYRRAVLSAQVDQVWTLDRRARQLVAPDGGRADLSPIDLSVLECFVHAAGQTVTREDLHSRLAAASEGGASVDLNATIYRLRRRVERATPAPVPLQSKSKVGYAFNGKLVGI
ncbi:MAG: transcriptional regulator [Burkholderiales bacterium PBB5]|nr:MAG: transcriptional regulator [Burkholderiales bacterium PBB5]